MNNDPEVEAATFVPPPFPTWPPPSGGAPFPGNELGPITNPYPPFLAMKYPQSGGVGNNGQNQGGSYQLPKPTKPWEVGPIASDPTISAIKPTPIMGPGPQGTSPY